jgi:hypothetical protein
MGREDATIVSPKGEEKKSAAPIPMPTVNNI